MFDSKIHKPSRASLETTVAAPASAGVIAAGEDRLSAVNGNTRNRAVAQPVVQRINLVVQPLLECRGLRRLRCRQSLHVQFLAELGDFIVLGVNLVLTQLVKDSLRACGLIRQQVSDTIGQGRAIRTVLRRDSVLQALSRQPVVAAILLSHRLFILYFLWFPISSDYIFTLS